MINYFEFYGIEEKYTIDKTALRQKYIEISRKTHPDYFQKATSGEQDAAEKTSSINNQAYATLNHDMKRIEHLLQVKNLLSESGENLSDVKLSNQFLGEMMELNERSQELVFEPNEAHNQAFHAEIEQLKAENHQNLINQLTLNTPETLNWKEILKLYLEQKYLLRIQNSLRNFAV